MALSVPMLDIFFIDFSQPTTEKKKSIFPKLLKNTAISMAYLVGGPVASLASVAGLKILDEDGTSLKRLIDEKRFNIIATQIELGAFVNANGNEWIINDKALKRRQYYVRHPKKTKQNILVEAKDFYNYIEEEQKDELIDFILSHCPAKSIQIDRTEIIETRGSANANVKGADLNGGANYGEIRGNYYSYSNPNSAPKVEPRENYLWIDKSIMRSIAALTEGASLTQSYESDFTFGLSGSEAKTIGLDLGKHKKFSYTIQIQC